MSNHVKLTVEDDARPVLIGTDASLEGMGFWRGQAKAEFTHLPPEDLTQDQIEILQYASKAFNPAAKKASAAQRDILGVIYALKKCEPFFQGRRFYLFTDHQAQVWLFSGGHTTPMLLRWIDLLMSLDYVVIHWKGTNNVIADALSRGSCLNSFNFQDYDPDHNRLVSLDHFINVLEFNSLWCHPSLKEGNISELPGDSKQLNAFKLRNSSQNHGLLDIIDQQDTLATSDTHQPAASSSRSQSSTSTVPPVTDHSLADSSPTETTDLHSSPDVNGASSSQHSPIDPAKFSSEYYIHELALDKGKSVPKTVSEGLSL